MYYLMSLIYKEFKDMRYFLVGTLTAIFLDMDHVLDYLIFNHFSRFNLREFLTCEFYASAGIAHVYFHGWEYLVLLLLAFICTKKGVVKNVLFALALGMFAHLLFDTIINGLPDYFYFITLRSVHQYKM